MNLHTLKGTKGAAHRRKRVGRGESSGWGKTAGRGNKGQHARSGSGYRPAFEGGQMPLIRRLPKRGFNNPFGTVYHAVNIADLEKQFAADADITPEALRKAGLANGRQPVKVLGRGDLTKKLVVKAHAFSASARRKIEEAGGTCETVS